MRWQDSVVHFIDFEGNGYTGVLEYGVVTVAAGKIIRTATRLCQGLRPPSVEDTSIHGIEEEDVCGAAGFSAEWKTFSELRSTGVLAAHHAQVENGLLRKVWLHPPLSPDFLNRNRSVAEWGPWLDTLQLYRSIYPNEASYSLAALIARFQLQERLDQLAAEHCPISRSRYHCALYDSLASVLLLITLCEQEPFHNVQLSWLLAHSAPPGKERQRRRQQELQLEF